LLLIYDLCTVLLLFLNVRQRYWYR